MKMKLIGVTLSGPYEDNEFDAMAIESARSFTESTGITSTIVRTAASGNYSAKMQLAEMFPNRTVVFFDSDVLWIRKVDLTKFAGRREFFAVQDCLGHPLNIRNGFESFSTRDAKKLGLDVDKYFNAGVMIFNHRYHRNLLKFALDRCREGVLEDYGDQGYLNWAVQRSRTPLHLLPVEFNTIIGGSVKAFTDVCSNPYAIHAAGVPIQRKRDLLKEGKEFFSKQ